MRLHDVSLSLVRIPRISGYFWAIQMCAVKGKFTQKWYLVVLGALSRMVKVWGAWDTPFWIYKRLNNCAAPHRASDDVLVPSGSCHIKCCILSHQNVITYPVRGGAIIQSVIYQKQKQKTAYHMHLGAPPFINIPGHLPIIEWPHWKGWTKKGDSIWQGSHRACRSHKVLTFKTYLLLKIVEFLQDFIPCLRKDPEQHWPMCLM